MDALDVYNLLEDHPAFGVWFSIDPDAVFFAGIKVGLMDIQSELFPYNKMELALLFPAPMYIGHT